MGQDKAYLKFHSKPQIEYIFDLLEKYCVKVFISIRPGQKLSFPNVRQSFRLARSRRRRTSVGNPGHAISGPPTNTFGGDNQIEDIPPFINVGPLAGILSAMKEYPNADWLVMACDLPFVTDETIQTLISLRDPQKQATAFISTQDTLPEPLCAIWEGHAYDSILKLFNEGIDCPRKILIKSDTHLLEPNDPHWLDNINTPQEYQKIRNSIILKGSVVKDLKIPLDSSANNKECPVRGPSPPE